MTGGKDDDNGDAPIPGETAPSAAPTHAEMQDLVDQAQTVADALEDLGANVDNARDNLDATQEALDNAPSAPAKGEDNGGNGGGDDWSPY